MFGKPTQREMSEILAPFEQELQRLKLENESLRTVFPKTINVNAIPGRRMYFTLHQTQAFTASQNGLRYQPLFLEVGRDGLFVMTGYPVIMWKASAGGTTGRWRPVSHWPLPDQVSGAEIIDVSYELLDAGPNRNMQSAVPVPAGLISKPENFLQLPLPQIFQANTVLALIPTYNEIDWTDTTAGILAVDIPGYKIIQ